MFPLMFLDVTLLCEKPLSGSTHLYPFCVRCFRPFCSDHVPIVLILYPYYVTLVSSLSSLTRDTIDVTVARLVYMAILQTTKYRFAPDRYGQQLPPPPEKRVWHWFYYMRWMVHHLVS